MSIHDRYFPGTTVSRYLIPGERSWDSGGLVTQSGKPILDSELNLAQTLGSELLGLIEDRTVPSGFLRGPTPQDPLDDFANGAASDQIQMVRRTALVANTPVVVEYTNTATPGNNVFQLSPATIYTGAPPTVKRTDFIFLEVWKALVSPSPRATATVTVFDNANVVPTDVINVNGVPLTAVAGAPAVDQFQIGANEAATAANISNAINDPLNSFTGICTAQVDVSIPEQVNLRAADPFAGAAGNALTLSLVLGTAGVILVNGGAGPTTFAGGADAPNKPSQTTLYRWGNVDANSAVNLPDDLMDPIIGTESTARVQTQYRIRVTGAAEAVNFKQENGFDNPNVLAQGAEVAPVATYPFVPADGSTVSGNSSAVNYGTIDAGLWIAGDGTQTAATDLGTVDGYVYAIPVCFVFRRNDAYDGGAGQGFDPLVNTNGALPFIHAPFVNPSIGAIGANESDRPDERFHDFILVNDILDLRRQVSPGGVDLKAELERQMSLLLDGTLRTWALDSQDKNVLGGGSGDVGTRFLVCNEIGRSAASGGVAPSSGSTNRGDSIANFDHIRRRFADQPIIERLVLPIMPTDAIASEPGKFVTKVNPLFLGWQEGDVITLDLSSLDATGLGDWANNPSGAPLPSGAVTSLWPPGTKVSNVLRVIHDEGHYTTPVSKEVLLHQIVGVGTSQIDLTLASNAAQINGGDPLNADHDMVASFAGLDVGSQRAIWIELEVTYPIGSGTTDTVDEIIVPDPAIYPHGPVLEDDTTQRPDDWDDLAPIVFRQSYREIATEYICDDGSVPGGSSGIPISLQVISDSPTSLTLPRRFFGAAAGTYSGYPIVNDDIIPAVLTVDVPTTEYGSSSRLINLDGGTPFSGAGQTLTTVQFWAQDPLPNFGAVGYQIAVYFRSNAPQTLGVQAGAPGTAPMPTWLTVKPFVMSKDLWSGTVGTGSIDEAFPYSRPLDQIPVNADTPIGDYPGEWVLEATAELSVGDFSAATGLLNLHQMVPVDPNAELTFTDLDVDMGFRLHYKLADPNTYRPTAMAQPLSSVANHKVFFPFLARATVDDVLYRAGEVLLIVVTRYGVLDSDNTVVFSDSNNRTCAAVYKTSGLLILASE